MIKQTRVASRLIGKARTIDRRGMDRKTIDKRSMGKRAIAKRAIECATLLAILQPVAFAADSYDNSDDKGWEFDLLLGAMREPTYVGSDKYVTEAGGDFQASYNTGLGREYFISLGEVGVAFELGHDWEFTALLEYEEGRDNGEDPILANFPKVRDTLEGQFILAKKVRNWTLAGVLQPDILNRGKGFVYFFAMEHEAELSHKLSLNTTLDISFADAEHMNTEVGITNAVAASSGLNAYNASSGYKSTTLGVQLEYAISQRWSVLANAEAEFYGSNIADSPLVKDEGSDTNYATALGVKYSF